jgi:hypothetical protein
MSRPSVKIYYNYMLYLPRKLYAINFLTLRNETLCRYLYIRLILYENICSKRYYNNTMHAFGKINK